MPSLESTTSPDTSNTQDDSSSTPRTNNNTSEPIQDQEPVKDFPPHDEYTNLSRHPITDDMVFAPIPNREYHEGFMRQAIGMAEMALASDETPVGCVFVRDGEVIGRGINGTNASLNVCRCP